MGITDHLRSVGRGAGRTTVHLPLHPGEREVMRVHATTRRADLRFVAGHLALTTHRVAFLPYAADSDDEADAWPLPEPGAICAVVAGAAPSHDSGPTLIVTDDEGIKHVFAVLAGIWSPNESISNAVVRDRFVTAARQSRNRLATVGSFAAG